MAILDRDTVRRRDGLQHSLGAFASGKVRVLIGTQMVAKGHHFPAVTLTGVISADALLGLPDFRAAERTFQLLTQVAGRSGRGSRPGRVIIQTYYPDHPAVRHAAGHDVASFLDDEMVFRNAFGYPADHSHGGRALRVEQQPRAPAAPPRRAARAAAPLPSGVRLRGPAPAPIERIRGSWRWQLLVTAPNRELLREILERIEAATAGPARCEWSWTWIPSPPCSSRFRFRARARGIIKGPRGFRRSLDSRLRRSLGMTDGHGDGDGHGLFATRRAGTKRSEHGTRTLARNPSETTLIRC